MAAKSKTCTCGQCKNTISWHSLANFVLYKHILGWNNERTSNPIVGNIKTRNEVCQRQLKDFPAQSYKNTSS